MLTMFLGGIALCTPVLLPVWGLCWWGRTPRWLLVAALIAASLLGYRISLRWVLSSSGEIDHPSEARGVLELLVGVCQALAFVIVLVPALRLQKKRRNRSAAARDYRS